MGIHYGLKRNNMKILFYTFDGFAYLLGSLVLISLLYYGVLFFTRDRRARKLLESNPKGYVTSDEAANINRYELKKGFIEIEPKTDKEKYEIIKDNIRMLTLILGIIALGAVLQYQNWLIAFISITLIIFLVQISK